MMDEVEANLTGYLFTSTPNKAVDGSYGVKDFRAATKPGGNYTQLAGKEEQLSIHTPISVFQKYTQNTLISSFPGVAENPNATVGDAITNINSRSKNSLKYLWGDLLKK